MTRTQFGHLHVHYGPDMDGSNRTFEWIEDKPQLFGMTEEQFAEYQDHNGSEEPGWFAMCEVEPEAGWVGPFPTEAEAVAAATNEDIFWAWQVDVAHGDDPMGAHMGRNV